MNDFVRLLSVLRRGDHRFLPLLLSKVHDVLPRLVNPMLQTVPDTPAANLCADVDIFDGFGNAGMGVPSNFPGYNGDGTSGNFKVEPDTDFNATNVPLAPFDKRVEELASPLNAPSSNSGTEGTPFTSPPIIQSPMSSMEYPGMGQNGGGFQYLNTAPIGNNINANQMGSFNPNVGGGQVEFKQEFDGNIGLNNQNMPPSNGVGPIRRPPLRQSSGSSFGVKMPRSIPEQYRNLHRANTTGGDLGQGMGGEMGFR